MVELVILTGTLLVLGLLGKVKLKGFEKIFIKVNEWMNNYRG